MVLVLPNPKKITGTSGGSIAAIESRTGVDIV